MKCQFLEEGFGFPECYSVFDEPLYPLEFRYEGYCTKENHINCPFYQASKSADSHSTYRSGILSDTNPRQDASAIS